MGVATKFVFSGGILLLTHALCAIFFSFVSVTAFIYLFIYSSSHSYIDSFINLFWNTLHASDEALSKGGNICFFFFFTYLVYIEYEISSSVQCHPLLKKTQQCMESTRRHQLVYRCKVFHPCAMDSAFLLCAAAWCRTSNSHKSCNSRVSGIRCLLRASHS